MHKNNKIILKIIEQFLVNSTSWQTLLKVTVQKEFIFLSI